MRKAYSVIIALLVASACNSGPDLTQPNVIEAALPGSWAQSNVVPGSATILHLTVTETAISGDGTYAIEAGRGGTVSVQGEIADSRVIIDFTRSDGIAAHYDATLKTHDVLRGSLSYSSGVPNVVEFHRVTP